MHDSPPHYQFLQTADGSPTLRLTSEMASKLTSELASESMHSLKGAFSETVYIYGAAIQATLENDLKPHFLSMGLGLGYNELLTTAWVLRHAQTHTIDLNAITGESFEAVPELNSHFFSWLKQTSLEGLAARDFENAYNEILELCSRECGVEKAQIRNQLLHWIESGQWRLRDALLPTTEFSEQRFSCYLYDAFCSKTAPELWAEEFLITLLKQTADRQAVFATYACTGTLKRSLKAAGFALENRKGYASKRDCTFANKGL